MNIASAGVLAAASSDFSNITTGVTNQMGVVSTVMGAIIGDPVLCTLFAGSFIMLGIGIISRLKGA